MRSPTPSLRLLELTELPVTVPVCVRDTPAAAAEGDDLSSPGHRRGFKGPLKFAWTRARGGRETKPAGSGGLMPARMHQQASEKSS